MMKHVDSNNSYALPLGVSFFKNLMTSGNPSKTAFFDQPMMFFCQLNGCT